MNFEALARLARRVTPHEFVVYVALRALAEDVVRNKRDAVRFSPEDLERLADGDVFVYATIGQVAELAGVSEPTVKRAIRSLVSRGWVGRMSDLFGVAETILALRGRWLVDDVGEVVPMRRKTG